MDDAPQRVARDAQRPAGPSSIELLHVDEDVVVANKPSGLLVHRGWARDEDVAMFRVRDQIGERVHPVHRLDRGTSGALVFARHPDAARALGRAFEAGDVEKRYVALVRGRPPPSGRIDHPITPEDGGAPARAVTRFVTIACSATERCALVLAIPETGRLHQVRRHLRHINHPLIGDVRHGSGAINRHYRAGYGLFRLALHAVSIDVPHPSRRGRLVVYAPLPDDLARPLVALGVLERADNGLSTARAWPLSDSRGVISTDPRGG